MPKILIDFGHGGSDPGAVAQIRESQYTLSYGLELGRALTQLGFDVAYSRTSDVDVSLSQRCALANNFGADYFVSVHFNAGGGHGIETYALAPGGHAEILANAVQKELIAQTNSTNRGVKFANFQVLRDTSMPAILIEGGFVDSDSDSAMIPTEDYRRKYVRAVTRAICGVTRASWHDVYTPAVIVPPVVIPPIVPPAPDVMYRIILDGVQTMATADKDKAIALVHGSVDTGAALIGIVQRNDGVEILSYTKPVVVPPSKDKNAQIIGLLEQLILVLKS